MASRGWPHRYWQLMDEMDKADRLLGIYDDSELDLGFSE